MRALQRLVAVLVVAVLAAPQSGAVADDPFSTFAYSGNMTPVGASLRPNPASGVYNSDLAFWGTRAYQGTYDGFRILDITDPSDPRQLVDYRACAGSSASNQGDVIVWDKLLVRSWNSPTTSLVMCDGVVVPPGFEGLHVFDVANPADPNLVATVPLPCGSHTATGVPDLANGRLLVYNSASTSACPWIEIVSVPLTNPALARLVNIAPTGRGCHDTSVILGEAMYAACAGGNGLTVFSIGGARGGTLTEPAELYRKTIAGVSIGHSTAFAWDGEILVFGHEPGGGGQAQCQAATTPVNKSLFFFNALDGTELGRWVLPRAQSGTENCTIHNFNVVPTDPGRRVLVSGNYQSGIAVVDFTDPAEPVEIAYADPAPLAPKRLGGDWSSYWYNGAIYESDITRGLLVWRLDDKDLMERARALPHANPQTQEFTIR